MGRGNVMLGMVGEGVALNFLKAKGYKIVETNRRTPFGEIDIVAKKKGFLVFIEVKTRMTGSLGPPYLSITKDKKGHIIKSAMSYLQYRRLSDPYWRIDVVSIKLNGRYEVETMEIIENAVEEGDGY